MKRPLTLVLTLLVALPTLALFAACSRSAPKGVRSEPETPATSEQAAGSPHESAAEADADDEEVYAAEALPEDAEKKEEPSLSQPPASAPAEEWTSEATIEQLHEEEKDFARAIDPSALSCSGALPLKDTICTLAERICALAPEGSSKSAQKDCKSARASCDKAKQSYSGRCGG